jgi:hypothetical protein
VLRVGLRFTCMTESGSITSRMGGPRLRTAPASSATRGDHNHLVGTAFPLLALATSPLRCAALAIGVVTCDTVGTDEPIRGSPMTTSNNPARRMYNVIAFGSLVAGFGIAFVALYLLHHSLLVSLSAGFCWGIAPLGVGWGVAELTAPGWVIGWRERMISGVEKKPLADYFSKRFAISGSEPWTSPIALRRVRSLGIALTTFWLGWVTLLLWITPRLN